MIASPLLGVSEVARLLDVHRATVYRKLESDDRFPRPVRISGAHGKAGGRVAWLETEANAYVEGLIADRDEHYARMRHAAKMAKRRK